MNGFIRVVLATLMVFVSARVSHTQNANNPAEPLDTPAVSGYEQELSKKLVRELKVFSPKTDNVGNVWVEFGSGEPHRLIATGMDQPGYIVSAITSDGYLRVQRLPQAAPKEPVAAAQPAARPAPAQPAWPAEVKPIAGINSGRIVPADAARSRDDAVARRWLENFDKPAPDH